nr:hypothetical protein [Pseudomonas chengduensis]
MILDKLSDFFYEQASLFLTRWRAGCFLVICLLFSDVFFKVLEKQFWVGSLSDAARIFSAVLDLPVVGVVSAFLLCFVIAPAISKALSLWMISIEFKRAAEAMDNISKKVAHVERGEVFRYRDKAVSGEEYIFRLKGINESLVTFFVLGCLVQFYGEVSVYCVSLLVVSPFLFYFMVQNIFSVYLKTVFFYKKLSEYLSTAAVD